MSWAVGGGNALERGHRIDVHPYTKASSDSVMAGIPLGVFVDYRRRFRLPVLPSPHGGGCLMSRFSVPSLLVSLLILGGCANAAGPVGMMIRSRRRSPRLRRILGSRQ